MPTHQDYVTASTLFGRQLMELTDEQWYAATPCDEWDVQALVAHLVLGEAMMLDLLSGNRIDPVPEMDVSILGPNPLATWRGTAIAAMEAASAQEVEEKIYTHPMGEVPGSIVLGFRITENLIHAWDLAQARNQSLELPDDLAERCLEFWLPLADSLVASGMVGAPVHPPEDAAAGVRLLALFGRSV